MSNPREKNFNTLSGVPLHYARQPIAPYGTRGKHYRFYSTISFYNKLEACFNELFTVCPLGKPEVITTAGVFVDKPSSLHNQGRAFDLDGIFWKNRDFITLNYPNDKVFYLGVEAVLRKHFGTVLQFIYDRRHEDHFHLDDGSSPGFKKDWKSYTYFLQSTLNNLFGKQLVEDGLYGTQTNKAKNEVFDEYNIPREIETKENWIRFLNACIDKAFKNEEKEKTPKELLQAVYETINTSNIDPLIAKKIESSLTAFTSHVVVADFLEING